MAISLVTVGGKITAAVQNAIIGQVNAQGLTAVIPTSAAGTGVSVGASGKVTAAAATTVSVNGCFTSSYDNYKIVVDLSNISATAIMQMRLRLAGTDATGATDYSTQVFGALGTSSLASINNTAFFYSTPTGSLELSAEINLFRPALAIATRGTETYHGGVSATSQFSGVMGWRHNQTIAYDGFTLYPASGNITGTIRVYGWNNN